MPKHPWRLSEISLADVRALGCEIVVLPFGATEPHNLHMPYGTDVIQVEAVCDRACQRAWEGGARVALLPAIPFGAEQNLMGFPLAINLDQELLNQIVESVAKSLEQHKIMKLVIVNGHGGNDFKGCLRTVMGRSKVFCTLINWYQMAPDLSKELFVNPGDHADEMETSMILALQPELIDMSVADAGSVRASRFEALRKGWAWSPRDISKLTTNSGVGDPRQASAEKGRRYFETITERFGKFLVELSAAKMDEKFPFA